MTHESVAPFFGPPCQSVSNRLRSVFSVFAGLTVCPSHQIQTQIHTDTYCYINGNIRNIRPICQ